MPERIALDKEHTIRPAGVQAGPQTIDIVKDALPVLRVAELPIAGLRQRDSSSAAAAVVAVVMLTLWIS